MEHAGDPAVDVKLKALIRHLVTTFPQTSILSRQVGETYHVFVIVPYEGGPEKTIQVDWAILADRHATVDEFCVLLESLHLPTHLQSCERYDLRHADYHNLSLPALGSWAQGTRPRSPVLVSPPTEDGP